MTASWLSVSGILMMYLLFIIQRSTADTCCIYHHYYSHGHGHGGHHKESKGHEHKGHGHKEHKMEGHHKDHGHMEHKKGGHHEGHGHQIHEPGHEKHQGQGNSAHHPTTNHHSHKASNYDYEVYHSKTGPQHSVTPNNMNNHITNKYKQYNPGPNHYNGHSMGTPSHPLRQPHTSHGQYHSNNNRNQYESSYVQGSQPSDAHQYSAENIHNSHQNRRHSKPNGYSKMHMIEFKEDYGFQQNGGNYEIKTPPYRKIS